MKSKITLLLTGLVAITQLATGLHAQQIYSVGDFSAGQAALQPQPAAGPTHGQPAQLQTAAAPPPAMQYWQASNPAPAMQVSAPRDLNSIVTAPTSAPAFSEPSEPADDAAGTGYRGDADCDSCDSSGTAAGSSLGDRGLLSGFLNGGIGAKLRHGNLRHGNLGGHLLGGLVNSYSSCFGIADSGCPRPSWIWADGEAMLLWTNGSGSVPPLATTSPAGTPFDQAGVLGLGTTTVLFGGDLDDDADLGYRGMVGVWGNPEQTWGIAGRGLYFNHDTADFSVQSTGSPILARPYFDVEALAEDSLVVAYPAFTSGSINIDGSTEIRGFELFLRKMLYYGYGNRIDFLGGFHSTRINDSLRINDVLVVQDGGGLFPVGTEVETDDIFKTKNEFYGGEVVLMAQGFDGRLTWNLISKVSLGSTQETVSISGQSTTSIPGGSTTTRDSGLLALPSNIGVYERDEFTIVPELSLNLAYSLTSRFQATVGYTFMYWSNVAMAAEAVNTSINPTQIDPPVVGPDVPVYSLTTDDSFWVQGLTFGLNARF